MSRAGGVSTTSDIARRPDERLLLREERKHLVTRRQLCFRPEAVSFGSGQNGLQGVEGGHLTRGPSYRLA